MQELLDACHLKVIASEDHLHRLEDAAERFFEDKTEVAVIGGEANPQRTKYLFRVEDVIAWPAQEWGIIIGDAVHCMRSALDHLVFGLAKQPSRETAFPICRRRKDWVTKSPAMLWSVHPGIVTIIDEAQPYHRGDAAAEHPLALLAALSNLDKHRAIPTAALVPDDNKGTVKRVTGIAKWGAITFHKGRIYEPGAVVAECSIVPDNSGAEPKMNVHFESVFDIGFGAIPGAASLKGEPVVATFNDTLGGYAVDEIFNRITDIWNKAVIAVEGTALHPEAAIDDLG